MSAPKKRKPKRRPRIDRKRWTRTHWLKTPRRLLGDKGPLIVGVTDDAKPSVKEQWL